MTATRAPAPAWPGAGFGQAAEHAGQRGVEHGRAEHAVGQAGELAQLARAGRGVEQRGEDGGVRVQEGRGGFRAPAAEQGGQRGEQGVQRHRPVQRAARCEQDRVAGRGPPGGPGAQQRGLADAGLALDDHDLGAAAAGPAGDRVEVAELVVAADDAGLAAGMGGGGCGGGRGAGGCGTSRGPLAAQDRGVQRDGLRGRVGAQLAGQPLPCSRVGGQRRGQLSARGVGPQQQAQRGFVVGVLVQGRGRGVGRGRPVAGLQQQPGGDPAGPAGQPGQLGLALRGPLAGRGGRRAGAADQGERHPGGGRRAGHVAGLPAGGHLVDQAGQLGRVQPVVVQPVAAVLVADPFPAAEDRAEAADQHRQLVLGAGRGSGGPQRVGQHVGSDDGALAEGQQVQYLAGLAAAQGVRGQPVHAEVAEDPDGQRLHGAHPTGPRGVAPGQPVAVEGRGSRGKSRIAVRKPWPEQAGSSNRRPRPVSAAASWRPTRGG